MSSYTIKKRKRPTNFVVAAAKCGVRNALRPFIRHPDIAFVAVLHVPEGTCEYYKRATEMLIADPMPLDEDCNELAVVLALYDVAVEPGTLFRRYRHGRQVVLLTERVEHIPFAMRAAADVVQVVAPLTSEHYEVPAREIGMSSIMSDVVRLITGFSFDVLSESIMGTRPLSTSVRRLGRVASEREKSKLVPIRQKGSRLEDTRLIGVVLSAMPAGALGCLLLDVQT